VSDDGTDSAAAAAHNDCGYVESESSCVIVLSDGDDDDCESDAWSPSSGVNDELESRCSREPVPCSTLGNGLHDNSRNLDSSGCSFKAFQHLEQDNADVTIRSESITTIKTAFCGINTTTCDAQLKSRRNTTSTMASARDSSAVVMHQVPNGKHLDTSDVLTLLLNAKPPLPQQIPDGPKENVYMLIDNSRNDERKARSRSQAAILQRRPRSLGLFRAAAAATAGAFRTNRCKTRDGIYTTTTE
jgi:hypothetical protein